MRFLFFNIVVGAALLYLYKGGDIDLSQLTSAASPSSITVAAHTPAPEKPKPGHARDVIDEPVAPTPKPLISPKKAAAPVLPTQTEKAVSNTPKPEILPAIKKEISVAKRTTKLPQFGNIRKPVDPAVAQRRSEVLENAPTQHATQDFALKEGTSLMSATDRRRSLDALAEEMEMLFLEQVGG